MTVQETAIKLPAFKLEHLARGTQYQPKDDRPFQAAQPRDEYEPVEHEIAAVRPQRAAANAAVLHYIALEVLSEPRLFDPDCTYVESIFRTIIEQLYAADRLSIDEYDLLSNCLMEGTRAAAHAVAAAWLRERGSLPIASS